MPRPLAHPWKLNYKDYLGFPEDGHRHEILDGDHVVTPAPSLRHQSISRWLIYYMTAWTAEHGGTVFAAPVDVVLAATDVLQPDLLYVSPDRAEILTEANVQGAPDLVIEILSESTRGRDEVTKRHLYARYGVDEYWIVDPVLETVKMFRDAENGFAEPTLVSREKASDSRAPSSPASDSSSPASLPEAIHQAVARLTTTQTQYRCGSLSPGPRSRKELSRWYSDDGP